MSKLAIKISPQGPTNKLVVPLRKVHWFRDYRDKR